MDYLVEQSQYINPEAALLLNQINLYYRQRSDGADHEAALLTALNLRAYTLQNAFLACVGSGSGGD